MATKGFTVMVVDDEPMICMALQRILEREGYHALIAFDGVMALELMARNTPDLVVLDIMMPGMDGLELSRRIHEITPCHIVFFTARFDLIASAKAHKTKELLGEADAFIAKPATSKHILSVVSNALADHKYLPINKVT